MKKPDKSDFVHRNQVDTHEYSKALEKYIDWLKEKWEPKTEICPECEGTGWIQNDEYKEDCMKCNWSGRIEVE